MLAFSTRHSVEMKRVSDREEVRMKPSANIDYNNAKTFFYMSDEMAAY